MYVQREESVHICFVQDKEADGKRHINGRPAQGEKLLGDPAAVQSPTVMVQATGVKPALNWANVFFGEASWFLIGPTFLREPSWKYSSKLYSGSKNLRSTYFGNIRPIGRSLPLIG